MAKKSMVLNPPLPSIEIGENEGAKGGSSSDSSSDDASNDMPNEVEEGGETHEEKNRRLPKKKQKHVVFFRKLIFLEFYFKIIVLFRGTYVRESRLYRNA